MEQSLLPPATAVWPPGSISRAEPKAKTQEWVPQPAPGGMYAFLPCMPLPALHCCAETGSKTCLKGIALLGFLRHEQIYHVDTTLSVTVSLNKLGSALEHWLC